MKDIELILKNENIEYFSITSLENAEIINKRLMPLWAKTAIMFLIPYRTNYCPQEHLAHFATIRDYHGFSKELFSRVIPLLEEKYPSNSFCGFADHSPINERKLAFDCGLGDIGMNGLLLNEKYGSYVFIGEILTDAVLPSKIYPFVQVCNRCERCINACPRTDLCISEISQKKKKTAEDFAILKKLDVVWGCDKCQEVCHVNSNAPLSPIEYFYIGKIKSVEEILQMSDERFETYSFSYRGRKIIEENIENIFKKDID